MEINDFMNRLAGELFIDILTAMGMSDGQEDDTGTDFLRLLIKNGCPTEAIIKTFKELSEKMDDGK